MVFIDNILNRNDLYYFVTIILFLWFVLICISLYLKEVTNEKKHDVKKTLLLQYFSTLSWSLSQTEQVVCFGSLSAWPSSLCSEYTVTATNTSRKGPFTRLTGQKAQHIQYLCLGTLFLTYCFCFYKHTHTISGTFFGHTLD